VAKRSLDDIFNHDPLGLLNVEIKRNSQHHSNSYLINGFNDIQIFFERTGRAPQLNESDRIEELRLATRLETFRKDSQITEKLAPYDKHQLLVNQKADNTINETPPLSIDDILSSELLGMESGDIFDMRHVTITEKSQSVNTYTANRKPCVDYARFQHKFDQIQSDLDNNKRETGTIEKISEIRAGQWFIVQGMLAYVAEMGEKYEHRKGHHNARLRVIFSNKTESDLLLRSFGAALYKDKSARRIYGATEGPLFGGDIDQGETPVGIVYVLKSLSQQVGIKEHREYLHKIGVTSGSVKARVSNAEKDPTYLLAPVEIVGEFKLYHMDVKATEKLLHKFFHAAQAEVEIKDRFGTVVRPREWFFVTVKAIQDAVKALNKNKILDVRYDIESGTVVDK
jgi:hypothetical protein